MNFDVGGRPSFRTHSSEGEMPMSTLDAEFATASAESQHVHSARSGAARKLGWILSGLALLFLSWDAAMKLVRHPLAIEGSKALGYSEHAIVSVGVIAAGCVVVYAVPRTAVLGAILWTGYLGGAIATHLRVGNPLLSHTLFPVYVAILLWGGLALRDPRVLALLRPVDPAKR